MPMAAPLPLAAPNTGYGGPPVGYPGPPAHVLQSGMQTMHPYAYEQQAPGYPSTGLDQAYSPMQPLLPGPYSAVPRPSASFVHALGTAQSHSPHVSSANTPIAPRDTPSAGFAVSSLSGGHINPARLAMLQASLDAAGYSSSLPNTSLTAEARPDAATEKHQVEEATRGAWSNVRRPSDADHRPVASGSSVTGSTLLNVKGTASQGGQTPLAQAGSSIAGSEIMPGRPEGDDAVPRPAALHDSANSAAINGTGSQTQQPATLNGANGSKQDDPTSSSAGAPENGSADSRQVGEGGAEQLS